MSLSRIAKWLLLVSLVQVSIAEAQTPTLVMHESSGRENGNGGEDSTSYNSPALTVTYFGPKGAGSLSGNCLVMAIENDSGFTLSTPTDNKSNTWHEGPSVTNTSGHVQLSGWYTTGAAGTTTIKINTSGSSASGSITAFSVKISEIYNSNCTLDTSGSASASKSVSLSTTTTDFLWEASDDMSNLDPGLTSITAGTGFTLLSANREAGAVAQWNPSAPSGSNTCTLTTSGSDTWSSICMAFQAASGGTAPSGMYVNHIQAEWYDTSSHTMQFPCSGNLEVAEWASQQQTLTISDSGGFSWNAGPEVVAPGSTDGAAQIPWGTGGTCSSTETITPTYSQSGLGYMMMFDIAGAPASPLDTSHTSTGNQTSAGPLIADSITPTVSGDLVLNMTTVYFDTLTTPNASGTLFTIAVNSGDDNISGGTPPSHLQDDDGRAAIYGAGTSAITWTYPNTGSTNGGTATGPWASASIAFKQPQPQDVPNPPTNLTSTVN
jgi:hypothetical protein